MKDYSLLILGGRERGKRRKKRRRGGEKVVDSINLLNGRFNCPKQTTVS